MKKSLAPFVYVFLGLIIGTLFIASSRSLALVYLFDEVIGTNMAIVLNILAILLLSTIFGFLFFKLNKFVYRLSGFTQYQFRQHFYFSQAIYVFFVFSLLITLALWGYGALVIFGLLLTAGMGALATNAAYVLSHVFLTRNGGSLTKRKELIGLVSVIAVLALLELFSLFSAVFIPMMLFA